MRAILLAAGEGARLRPHTRDRPKCLLELAGRPLIAHQLAVLEAAGIGDVHLVTGHCAEKLLPLGLPTHHNPDFARSNMVASLMCAAKLFDGGDDVLVAYADIVYEQRVLEAVCACPAPLATAVDEQWLALWSLRSADPLADAETLRIDADGNIRELGGRARSLSQIEAQYMGLTRVGAALAPALVRTWRDLDPDARYHGRDRARMHMTSFLQHLIDAGTPVRAVRVRGGWLELDTAEDLALYRRLEREGRLAALWRPPA